MFGDASQEDAKSGGTQKAWIRDSSYIATLIKQEREALAATNKSVYRDLVHLAQWWEQGMRMLTNTKDTDNKCLTQVVSPYAKRAWKAQKENTTDIPQVRGLRVATFGWWEIVLQTPENYTKLQNRL